VSMCLRVIAWLSFLFLLPKMSKFNKEKERPKPYNRPEQLQSKGATVILDNDDEEEETQGTEAGAGAGGAAHVRQMTASLTNFSPTVSPFLLLFLFFFSPVFVRVCSCLSVFIRVYPCSPGFARCSRPPEFFSSVLVFAVENFSFFLFFFFFLHDLFFAWCSSVFVRVRPCSPGVLLDSPSFSWVRLGVRLVCVCGSIMSSLFSFSSLMIDALHFVAFVQQQPHL